MEKNLLPWSRKSTTHCFAASPPHSVRFHDWASAASSKIATGCWPAAHAHSGHWPYSCSQQFSQLLGLKSCWGMHILPPPPNRETAGTAAWISTWVEDHWSAEKTTWIQVFQKVWRPPSTFDAVPKDHKHQQQAPHGLSQQHLSCSWLSGSKVWGICKLQSSQTTLNPCVFVSFPWGLLCRDSWLSWSILKPNSFSTWLN